MYFTIIYAISSQKQEPTFSESSEEMDSTENVNDKESDDEIEETDESDEDMADDQNDPDGHPWRKMVMRTHVTVMKRRTMRQIHISSVVNIRVFGGPK